MFGQYLFTSESVAIGHPDKIADQISDAILDACLDQDQNSRVACETMVSTGLVILAGEITTQAHVNYQDIARETIKKIGYTKSEMGFDYRSCGVLRMINRQSPDIAQGVEEGKGLFKELGAGDQGIMFGYACKETPQLMPLPIMIAHHIMQELKMLREEGVLPYLGPDAKAQVTVVYDEHHVPQHLHTIVISTQHSADVTLKKVTEDMIAMIKRIVPAGFILDDTRFFINPTGRFVVGGPVADCGMTGRKIVVDTYGGMARHGGGAFSGKDPSKVDRSASYAARYVAKNIVAADLAEKCEIQISYAIGVSNPISVKVDTFGTGVISDQLLTEAVSKIFDLSPKGIIEMLELKRPIYLKTAFGGHFGREEKEFTWERIDKVTHLKKIADNHLSRV